MNHYVDYAWKSARRVVILVIGSTIILIGIVGFLTPIMPGLIFIPIGLAVLATEFVWARRWLKKMKSKTQDFLHDHGLTGRTSEHHPMPDAPPAVPDSQATHIHPRNNRE